MDAADVIVDIRDQLNDDLEGHLRLSDAQALRMLSDAQRKIHNLHPALFLNGSGSMEAPQELTATTDVLKLNEHSRPVLVALVCSDFFMRDSDDTMNRARAKEYEALAMRRLGGANA